MSDLAYNLSVVKSKDKALVVEHGEIKSPPLSVEARREAGFYLRKLQQGESLSMPVSRPMPSIGTNCHELRIDDRDSFWRIIYKIYDNAIVVLEVFNKKSNQTPKQIINNCKARIRRLQ